MTLSRFRSEAERNPQVVRALTIVFALAVLASAAVSEERPGAKSALTTTKDLVFAEVDGRKIRLDLRVPKGVERPPLVVWIHGGGWEVGDKKKCRSCWLVHKGYAVASINYRLSPKPPFPAQIHDCKAAIRWLRANHKRLGYNASRIAVAGSSAGGHLAALLATSGDVAQLEGDVGGNAEESSRIQMAVSISGFSDLATSYASKADVRIVRLIGGTPEERPEQSRHASPVHFVGPGDAPLLLIHGEKDPIVDPQQAVQLQRAYQEAGLDSSLMMIPETGHMDLSTRDPALRARVEEFLAQHMRP
jgi:acetyl esterase/lipase